jgi:ribose/xylose/arabinose/galactoside ABC-type transport system permease subunit
VSRFLVTLGIVLVVAGLAWPLLAKLGLGRLPGDFHIEREGFSFYFPLTTGLVVSAAISLILWLLRK